MRQEWKLQDIKVFSSVQDGVENGLDWRGSIEDWRKIMDLSYVWVHGSIFN